MVQLTSPSKPKFHTDLFVLWAGICYSLAFSGWDWGASSKIGFHREQGSLTLCNLVGGIYEPPQPA